MTQNEFNAECCERLIDPAVALENDNVREALSQRDDARTRELLDSEF